MCKSLGMLKRIYNIRRLLTVDGLARLLLSVYPPPTTKSASTPIQVIDLEKSYLLPNSVRHRLSVARKLLHVMSVHASIKGQEENLLP